MENIRRGSMKRDLKPFVVEVKRGKRRSQLGKQFESVGLDSSLSEAAKRAEIALFASPPPQKLVAAAPPSPPVGRVLPSLIEIPPTAAPEADPLPRRRGRKPGSKNKPKPANGDHARAAEAPSAGRPKMSGNAAPVVMVRVTRPIDVRPLPPASTTAEAVRPAMIEPATIHEAAGSAPRPVRLRNRSSILARYVFGTEPGPGEQWKRRSRRKAAEGGKAGFSR